jgi:hypothetical protein
MMPILAVLMAAIAAMALLTILWMRVTARNQEVSRHRKMTTHLDWTSSSQGRRRAGMRKRGRA